MAAFLAVLLPAEAIAALGRLWPRKEILPNPDPRCCGERRATECAGKVQP